MGDCMRVGGPSAPTHPLIPAQPPRPHTHTLSPYACFSHTLLSRQVRHLGRLTRGLDDALRCGALSKQVGSDE